MVLLRELCPQGRLEGPRRPLVAAVAINLEQVAEIGRGVVSDVDERLRLVGVTATEGGGDRVELIVTVSGCHAEPCMHLINVSRSAPDAIEQEVREKLQQALRQH